MTNHILPLLTICCMLPFLSHGQTSHAHEDIDVIYWQPHTTIEFADYRSQSDTTCMKYYKKYGFLSSAVVSLWSKVDLPVKKPRGRRDKGYIAPVFCRLCSYLMAKDSLSLKVDRLCFDVAELHARGIRRELFDMQQQMNVDNIYTMFMTSVKNKWMETMISTWGTIFREILIDKKEGAYEGWRQTIDDLLTQTEAYATRPEDCRRFETGLPIEEGYREAEFIMGDMFATDSTRSSTSISADMHDSTDRIGRHKTKEQKCRRDGQHK